MNTLDTSMIKNDRLWQLMNTKKITDCKTFSYKLIDNGYYTDFKTEKWDKSAKSDSDEYNQYYKNVNTLSKSIKRCLYDNKYKNDELLIACCKFFDCSSDYLLGLIDLPTHGKTDFNELTGLSDSSISALAHLKKTSDINAYAKQEIETLDFLLSDMYETQKRLHSGNTSSILADIGIFINANSLEKEPVVVKLRTEKKGLKTLKIGDIVNNEVVRDIRLQHEPSKINANNEKIPMINKSTNGIYPLSVKELVKTSALNSLHEKLIDLEKSYQTRKQHS